MLDLFRFKTDINNAADADNCWIIAVNNSWLQVSCDGWCWHRENRMSNMFLPAPAAACGSDSDPFGNLQLKLQTAQRYYIIQSWGWQVSFRCFLCSSAVLWPSIQQHLHPSSQNCWFPSPTWPSTTVIYPDLPTFAWIINPWENPCSIYQ